MNKRFLLVMILCILVMPFCVAGRFCPDSSCLLAQSDRPFAVFEGASGKPGNGRHIVLISGDEEYRSEQMQTQLAKILAAHHGFRCTVLYAIDPKTGEIDPVVTDNIPGLETLETADLVVMFLRFRNLPDEQMKPIANYLEAGKPIIGIRTSTHAFNVPAGQAWSHYSFNFPGEGDDASWNGGFGRRVLGETWIDHHGHHKVEATRGIIAPGAEKHPIVTGCDDIFCPTDVYTVRLPLPGDSVPLVLGQVLAGMNPTDKPLEGTKNDPMMPVLWTKTYQVDGGKTGRAVTSTMGSALDMESAGFRRLMVNSCYWLLDMAAEIKPDANVDIIGEFKPLGFGFGQSEKGIRPRDLVN
ncbi:MAG: ThuA domain-containing protein [Planctomycetaceae bacterium]|nr:ThuA domain-containing protein [Planctomycetaceae bacterium]